MLAPPISEISPVTDEEHEVVDESSELESTEDIHLLYCFHCNRLENHYFRNRYTWYHSLLLGFTFGGILLIGPFRCLCCGACRLFSFDEFHPRVLSAKIALQVWRLASRVSRKAKELLNKCKFLHREND